MDSLIGNSDEKRSVTIYFVAEKGFDVADAITLCISEPLAAMWSARTLVDEGPAVIGHVVMVEVDYGAGLSVIDGIFPLVGEFSITPDTNDVKLLRLIGQRNVAWGDCCRERCGMGLP